jgi:glycosyltransferase involved in cell wall biosynthesis
MPIVSIIIPCFNEQDTIGELLAAIHEQTYPRENLEVIIADGLSTDQTRQRIADFQAKHPGLDIRLVDNPQKIIPAGLNRAIQASHGQIIIRLDAHSRPYPDYVARCVETLDSNLGDNVGGVWEIRPRHGGWIPESIAAAAAHPLGVGDALYRHASKPAYVDTVPFGAFKRELLALIGFFDETLLTNEDYEFNARIRKSGGKIWLDPSIRSVYYAQPSLRGLARQYWRYGFWKWRMLRRYPETLRWRQALPPLFVSSLILGLLAGFAFPIIWGLLAIEVLSYMGVLFIVSFVTSIRKRKPALTFGLPLAIAAMHISWGAGLLWSMIKPVRRKPA